MTEEIKEGVEQSEAIIDAAAQPEELKESVEQPEEVIELSKPKN